MARVLPWHCFSDRFDRFMCKDSALYPLLTLPLAPLPRSQELYAALTEKGIDCSGWSPAMAMNAVVYKTREMRDEQAIVRALQQAQKETGPPQIVFVLQEHGK